ncbi:MAG: hypothetical protein WDZ70_02635 [Candidatus Paceibacterota bacterium]
MEFSRDNLHHAYLIEGGVGAVEMIRQFIEKEFDISTRTSPDVIERTFNSMGIDDARWLKAEAQLRPLSGERRFFIIHTRSITTPGQNALLKTFEEPTEGTHLFLIVPRSDTILPTLLSRVEVHVSDNISGDDVEEFLKATPADRLEMTKEILEEDSDIDPTQFITGLERYIHALWEKERDVRWEQALREIVMVERYMYDSSASHRFLLEHLAVVLPVL